MRFSLTLISALTMIITDGILLTIIQGISLTMVAIIIPIIVIDIIPIGIVGIKAIITSGVSPIRVRMTVPVPVQNNRVITWPLKPLLKLLVSVKLNNLAWKKGGQSLKDDLDSFVSPGITSKAL